MSGQQVPLTEADFDRIVAGFDPADPDGSPLVFGHPSLDDPAYGWVQGVRRDGDKLLARFRDVPGTVTDLVAAGRYRNVSIKLSPDKSRLVHVGLLGAVPPAISGLAPVKFSAGDGLTIEFSNGGDMTELERLQAENTSLKARLANGESAARVKELEADVATAKDATAKAEAKATETAQAFAAYKAEQADTARERRFAALVAADKATPGEKASVLAFAKTLSTATGEIEFAAADGQSAKVSQEEAYWRGLEARQPQGLLHEFAAPGTTEQSQAAGKIPADLTKYM